MDSVVYNVGWGLWQVAKCATVGSVAIVSGTLDADKKQVQEVVTAAVPSLSLPWMVLGGVFLTTIVGIGRSIMRETDRVYHSQVNTVSKPLDLSSIRATNADHQVEQCVICLTNKKNVCYDQCRHLCICSECAKAVKDMKCPICRKNSNTFIHVVM